MREDWEECELGEVCLSSKGKKPPILENKISEIVNVPYINIKAFEKGIIDEYTDGNKCNLCEDGDLLMVWDGARAGLSGKARKGAVGSTLMKIEEVKGIEKQYLSYFLLSLYTKINTNPRGVGIPHVEPRILWYSKLLIVSSPIQRAIVSKIEALFSDLDNGIANFKKAQEQLKIYRQAVLKKAFEGELTKEWREKQTNLPTASALLKQIKEERQNHYNHQIEVWKKAVKEWEKNKQTGKKPSKPTQPKELPPLTKEELQELSKLPSGWKWEKIGLNFLSLDQGWSPKCENYPAKIEEWGVIKTTAVQANSFEEINNKKLPLKLSPRIQHELVKGDILITRAGPRNRVGICCLVNNVRSKLINCDKVYRIKAIVSNPTFIVYMLNSPAFSKELEKTKSGISDSGVNLKQDVFLKMPVPLCSLEEQNQIVQEIEFRLSVCDKMEQSINESIEKAEALRQSILKKAFEGKLLSKAEIELCKKEADYEPASELLKKIQAEKLAKELEKKKPTVKKKSKK